MAHVCVLFFCVCVCVAHCRARYVFYFNEFQVTQIIN